MDGVGLMGHERGNDMDGWMELELLVEEGKTTVHQPLETEKLESGWLGQVGLDFHRCWIDNGMIVT